MEVDVAVEQGREVGLVVDERETWSLSRIILDEDVEIAIGTEVVAQYRAE
ncbi:MAG: hypothetical protein R2748_00775 [Bryobacterales bacterium]